MDISLFHPMDFQPNRHPTIDQLFHDAVACAHHAEQLGYRAFFVTEHHFCHYGALPDPLQLLAYLGATTSQIQLGSAILVLPFHDPRRLASSLAQADLLTHNRLLWGVGSGFLPYEFSAFGLNSKQKREQFDHIHRITELLLSNSAQAVAACGETDHLILNVPVHDSLLDRRYIAGTGTRSPYFIGQQGAHLLFSPFESFRSPFSDVGDGIQAYRDGRTASQLDPKGGKVITSVFCHVAESDEVARRNVQPYFDQYVSTRNQPPLPVTHPGCFYDPYFEAGLTLFGSEATVRHQIQRLAQAGVDHIMTVQHFGGMPLAMAERSMTLLKEITTELMNEPTHSPASSIANE